MTAVDRRQSPGPGDAAAAAQLRDVHAALLRDAEAAGLDPATLEAAMERATAIYACRRVRTFLGVLVERAVREELGLRRTARL